MNLLTNRDRCRNIPVCIRDYFKILVIILLAHCFTYTSCLLKQSYAAPKKVEHLPLMQDYLVSEIYQGIPIHGTNCQLIWVVDKITGES